jgi:hypothetical protein
MMSATWNLLAPLRLFAIHPNGSLLGAPIPSLAALGVALKNLRQWNVYAHANGAPPGPRPRLRSHDVVNWRLAVIDIDPVSPNADPLTPALALGEQFDAHVVDTGRGAQVWVELTSTPIGTDSAREIAERGMGVWLRRLPGPESFGCVIDTSCSDLARLIRLPGSINQKTGHLSRLLRIGHPQPLATTILALAGSPVEPVSLPPPRKTQQLGVVLPHITQTAARFLTEGWETPGRHAAAYAAAASLRDAAISVDVAMAWVTRGGRLCRPGLPVHETQRTVQCAYRKR